MPLQVPLVDTFAPFREGLTGLKNALADAPRLQLQRAQVGEAQKELQQNQELAQIVSKLPTIEQRHSAAIQYLESKGRFGDAQKIKDVDLETIKGIAAGNPQEGFRRYLAAHGIDPATVPYQAPVGEDIVLPEGSSIVSRRTGQVITPGTPKLSQEEKEFNLAKQVKGQENLTMDEWRARKAESLAAASARGTASVPARPPAPTQFSAVDQLAIKAQQGDPEAQRQLKAIGAGRQATTPTDPERAALAREQAQLNIEYKKQQLAGKGDFRNESAMRQEFTKLPEVKTFQIIDSQMSRVQKAMQEARMPGARLLAVDQTLITVLNKMLDPTSVVRESEYARTPGDQAFLDSIRGKIDKISTGGAGLTPPERDALTRMIQNFYDVAKGQYDEQSSYYTELASRYGFDPQNIVRLGGKSGGYGKPATAPAAGGGRRLSVTAPNGKTYTFPDEAAADKFRQSIGQ